MSLQVIKQKVGSIAALKSQKGASALEYLVLAAAIIVIIGFLATNDTVQTTVTNAFQDLFTDAASAGGAGEGT